MDTGMGVVSDLKSPPRSYGRLCCTLHHARTGSLRRIDRQTDRQTQTDRHRQTDTDRQTQTDRHSWTHGKGFWSRNSTPSQVGFRSGGLYIRSRSAFQSSAHALCTVHCDPAQCTCVRCTVYSVLGCLLFNACSTVLYVSWVQSLAVLCSVRG